MPGRFAGKECPKSLKVPRNHLSFLRWTSSCAVSTRTTWATISTPMPEVHFDVNLKRRVGIERELYKKLDDVARRKNTTADDLVNAWVREKLKAETASEP